MSRGKYHRALTAVLDRVRGQARFAAAPTVTWVVNRYLDRQYLLRLRDLAGPYAVKEVCLTENVFRWAGDLASRSAVGDFLADVCDVFDAVGVDVGVLVPCADHVSTFEGCARGAHCRPASDLRIVDAAGRTFGQGALPYVAVDRVVAPVVATDGAPAAVEIDGPRQICIDSPNWANVFAASAATIDPSRPPDDILCDYTRALFGDGADAVKTVLAKARLAIEAGLAVLGTIWSLDDSTWPTSPAFYDTQLDRNEPPAGFDQVTWAANVGKLREPTDQVLGEIDGEKIDALEHAHVALQTLEQARDRLTPEAFLYLEHYVQRLKAICMVLRTQVMAYFARRAGKPKSTLIGRLKDLRSAVRHHQAIVAEMPSANRHINLARITRFIASCEPRPSGSGPSPSPPCTHRRPCH